MIIFELDDVLADIEHRRHFVDFSNLGNKEDYEKWIRPFIESKTCPEWSPDYKAFYEACDKDLPIEPTLELLNLFIREERKVHIWSERCESTRDKTIVWLNQFINVDLLFAFGRSYDTIKMRPIGDDKPAYRLKEEWYDLHNVEHARKNIEMVFESDPESIEMYRRRGIFVFDCRQNVPN